MYDIQPGPGEEPDSEIARAGAKVKRRCVKSCPHVDLDFADRADVASVIGQKSD